MQDRKTQFGDELSLFAHFVRTCREQGMDEEVMRVLLSNRGVQRQTAQKVRAHALPPPLTRTAAQMLLGRIPAEADPEEPWICALPWEWVFWDPGYSLQEWIHFCLASDRSRRTKADLLFRNVDVTAVAGHRALTLGAEPCYRRIFLEPCRENRFPNGKRQLLADAGEEIAPARVIVAAVVLQFLRSDEWLWNGQNIFQTDCVDGGDRMTIEIRQHGESYGIQLGRMDARLSMHRVIRLKKQEA